MNLRPSSVIAAAVGIVLSLSVISAPASAAGETVQGVPGSATQSTFRISWTAVPGATEYWVRYAVRADLQGNQLVKGIAGTTYVLRNLRGGTKYYFSYGIVAGGKLSAAKASGFYFTKPLMRIGVASYNIQNPTDSDLGPWYRPDGTGRGQRSAAAIVTSGVQLLGAQELYQEEGRTQFLQFINAKAGGPHFAMAGDITDNHFGYDNRIVYDKRIFSLIESKSIKYAVQARDDSPDGYEAARYLSWASLLHIPSGQYVLFLTTHISPEEDGVNVHVQPAQWNQLINFVNARRSNSKVPLRIIITGDFNVSKFEDPASSQLAKMRANGYHDVLGQQYRSYDTYRNPGVRVDAHISTSNKGRYDVSTYSVDPGRNGNGIDYVFVSANLKAPYYRVHAQPRSGNIMQYLMSDHFMVRATISQ